MLCHSLLPLPQDFQGFYNFGYLLGAAALEGLGYGFGGYGAEAGSLGADGLDLFGEGERDDPLGIAGSAPTRNESARRVVACGLVACRAGCVAHKSPR